MLEAGWELGKLSEALGVFESVYFDLNKNIGL